jgi:hypothetical protein
MPGWVDGFPSPSRERLPTASWQLAEHLRLPDLPPLLPPFSWQAHARRRQPVLPADRRGGD